VTGGGRTSVDVLLAVGYDPDPRVRRLTQVLAQDGFDIRVLAWDRDGTRRPREHDGQVLIERVHVKSGWSRGLVQSFYLAAVAIHYFRRVRRRRPDVLHAIDLPMLIIALMIAPLVGRPQIVYEAFEIYGVMVSHRMPAFAVRLIRFLERTLPRRADLVVTPGEMRQAYFAERGIESICIPNWIQPPAEPTPVAAARTDYDIPPDRFTILYAGSLHASRDLDSLLRHAARRPDELVLIAGQGDDEARLQREADRLENVRLLGWLRNPEPLLAAVDAVYYSLRPEHPYARLAAPNNLYQAIAHGVPLIYRAQGELALVGERDAIGVAFVDDPSLDAAVDELRDPQRNAEIRDSLRRLQARYRWSSAAELLREAYPRKGTAASNASANGP
jgi:glycosyltransferase involved in cell wall biosynthesis